MCVQRNTETGLSKLCCSVKQQVLHILDVCLLPYLSGIQIACAMLYCHLWPVCLYHIFPHYLIKGTIFGEKNLFVFSLHVA